MSERTPARPPQYEQRKRKRETFIIGICLVLISVLIATQIHLTKISSEVPMGANITIFGLINIITLLIILFVYLLARNMFKLFKERQMDKMGARLRTKLVLAFVSLSLFPTLLLFFVSAGYISNSIQNWFNSQIETSLDESMEVAQTYYKNSAANALFYSEQISQKIKNRKLLNDENLGELKALIKEKQKEYNLGVVEVFSAQREELVRAANPKLPASEFTNPSSEDLDKGLKGKEFSRVNSIGKADLIRGIVPVFSNWNDKDVVGVVVVNYYVPYSLVSKMKEITNSYHEFRQLKILKKPITTTYILTLLLITIVIITLSVWFGVNLARSLTDPIQDLAEATRQIADGNLEIKLTGESQDEIGQLIHSFNKMTADLKTNQLALRDANQELSLSNQEIEGRRRYMETVLRHITAGVISTNSHGVITTINKSAENLLQVNRLEAIGRNFRDVLSSEYLSILKEMLREIALDKKDIVNRQVELMTAEKRLSVQVNLTILKDENDDFLGTVVVMDDLTHILKAQRMAAWREVARRIAHEIKNPLTPIQLSAQRLRKRYLERFSADDNVFDQSTNTIIKSVEELKNLVNEFSQFARMPAAQLAPCSLNEIINESVTLYSDAHKNVRFSFIADNRLPEVMLDRDQIKRVLVNLLENAVHAVEANGDVTLETIYNPELKIASFSVSDTGHGIPKEDQPRLFEPYFSTKKSGTGLGLAIVSTIITDHHGFIRVRSNETKGTRFIIELPATR
ncbi:MAG: HAMP domain-containing protein [Geobacteraceae bacterium]|nr:HAMP domain-containing protein [Geobacteraceae bacterium]